MSRILLLEDDEALGRGICMALETPNCTVTHCSTRLQAIKILQGVVFQGEFVRCVIESLAYRYKLGVEQSWVSRLLLQ